MGQTLPNLSRFWLEHPMQEYLDCQSWDSYSGSPYFGSDWHSHLWQGLVQMLVTVDNIPLLCQERTHLSRH
jgi:hypothetical protein